MTATSGDPVQTPGPSGFWRAEEFAATLLAEFEEARRGRDFEAMRGRYYVLAAYYRRSLAILHSALEHRSQHLVEASLRNLIVLQKALGSMREDDPDDAPSSLALESEVHKRVNRDLVHRILREARGPLLPRSVLRRFNDLDLIADARDVAIQSALDELVETGYAVRHGEKYAPTPIPYVDANVDRASLRMLFGPALSGRLAKAGFEGVSHIVSRPDDFRALLQLETGLDERAARLASAFAAAVLKPEQALHAGGAWEHADLTSSAHPRRYQRYLHAVFRARRYAAQVIEAPAGSGKTLVGMLCIEDWLQTMAPGEAVLVLVPTVNYQRQWVDELCLKETGLKLSPNAVFSGTASALVAARRCGPLPAVIVMTYAALSQVSNGPCGFDARAVERILQAGNIRHVILDEVHRVAGDINRGAARATLLFGDWLRDGSISSLIGFSGTLAGFRSQLDALGLEIAFTLPAGQLIGEGWVAPFAEFGAPFNYSGREREVAELVRRYKDLLKSYFRHLGAENLRTWFRDIEITERVRAGAALGMYSGRPDRLPKLDSRMRMWERGGDLGLDEAHLIPIIQICRGWSDRSLLREAGLEAEFDSWISDFREIRARVRPLLPPGWLSALLDAPDFGERFDATVPGLDSNDGAAVRKALASTFTGLYLALRGWTRNAGEGRVAAVESIIDVERKSRRITGAIIFDKPGPLEVRDGAAKPGYRGAGGMFVHLLRRRSCSPMAVLTSAIYLPDDSESPVQAEIAGWIECQIIGREQRDALFALLAGGSGLHGRVSWVRGEFDRLYSGYVKALTGEGRTRLRDFDEVLLRPLRHVVRTGLSKRAAISLLSWLSLDRNHLRASATAILDYAAIAASFRSAGRARAVLGDGSSVTLRTLRVPGGRRRQLLLDLTARLVDAPDLSIDTVIVSDWARTGWNIVTPNVLIDATATRDLTAWQQLRGRAMRPAPTWSSTAQRLVRRRLGWGEVEGEQRTDSRLLSIFDLPPEEASLARDVLGGRVEGPVDGLEPAEDLAVAVMLARNKVTHVYELVRACGSRPQVQYSRGRKHWERCDAIAAKHEREEGVRPADGAFVHGASHAPLIVAADPRFDPPGAFQMQLSKDLASADERIVRGWLRSVDTRQGLNYASELNGVFG